jgi:NAD(P)-dependent dehydrogenase (short-subunit alcohol dehydrogenase family)
VDRGPQCGGLDIAVNTAGKELKKPIVEMTEEEFNKILRWHLQGLSQLLWPRRKGIPRSPDRRPHQHARRTENGVGEGEFGKTT